MKIALAHKLLKLLIHGAASMVIHLIHVEAIQLVHVLAAWKDIIVLAVCHLYGV